MMQSDNCRCGHHWGGKVIRVLTLLAAVVYVWTVWSGSGAMFGRTTDELFQHVVVLAAVLLSTRGMCKCCCGDKHCGTCSTKPM